MSSALAILAYCTSSISMTLVNKYVMSSFSYHEAFLMLTFQAGITVILLKCASALNLVTHKPLIITDLIAWLPVSLLQASMLYTGSKALQYLSVPFFIIFKNLTIVLVAYGERIWFNGHITPLMWASFSLIFASSLVGGYADITFNAIGYMWMILNCFSAAAFVLKMRGSVKSMKFKDLDTLYYNNVLTTPLFIVLGLITEHWGEFVVYYSMEEHAVEKSSLLWALLFSGVVGFYISFASAWCIRVTSSTTYSLTGALNKIPMAVLGMIFFNDVVTAKGVFAIVLGLISGLVYTYAKQVQKKGYEQVGLSALPLNNVKQI